MKWFFNKGDSCPPCGKRGLKFDAVVVQATRQEKATNQKAKPEENLMSGEEIDSRLKEIEALDVDLGNQITTSNNVNLKTKLLREKIELSREKKALLKIKMAIMENDGPAPGSREESEDTLLSFPFYTNTKGVTFEGRQAFIAESKNGDTLTIKHTPTSDYPNTISIINDRTGKNLGVIGNDLADGLLFEFGEGCSFEGEIDEVMGGGDCTYGCNIAILDIL